MKDYYGLEFTDRNFIGFVYDNYIDGLSVEDIRVKFSLTHDWGCEDDLINIVIDDVNLLFYA